MAYVIILELAVGNIVRRVLRLIRDVYNSEASNSNMTSSAGEKVEDEVEDDEDDNKVKSSSQKGRTFDLQSYGGTSSMINLLGDGSPMGEKRASLDYETKSFHILFFF